MVLIVLAYLGSVHDSESIHPSILPFTFTPISPFQKPDCRFAEHSDTFAAVLSFNRQLMAGAHRQWTHRPLSSSFLGLFFSARICGKTPRPFGAISRRAHLLIRAMLSSSRLTGVAWTALGAVVDPRLILTGAACKTYTHTSLLLLIYAAGAATSLAVALLAGGRVFAAMKRSLGAEEWIRRILGVAVLIGVIAVAFGLDRGILTRVSLASTSGVEQKLLDRMHPKVVRIPDQTLTITDAGETLTDSSPLSSLLEQQLGSIRRR